MYIKSTSYRTTKGMELNGNVLSGDTFGMRSYIKEYWDGKWDAARKVWIVNPVKVVDTITQQAWGFTRVLSLSNNAPATVAKPVHTYHTTLCPRCHTYCDGDCTAH